MKKLLIIILLLFSVSIQAQYLQPPRLNPAKGYTWTGTQMFYNILPTTTRLYNSGGSLNYWLNSYTQNLYVDTTKSDIVFSRDVTMDSTLLIRSNLQVTNGATLDSIVLNKPNGFIFNNDRTSYLLFQGSTIYVNSFFSPASNNAWDLGLSSLVWRYLYAGNIVLSTIPTYADDATAGTGGLTAGMFYKTATGELRIKL